MNAQSVPRPGAREPSPRAIARIRRELRAAFASRFPKLGAAGVDYMTDRSLPLVVEQQFNGGLKDVDVIARTLAMDTELEMLTSAPEAIAFAQAMLLMLRASIREAREVGGDPVQALVHQYEMGEESARQRVRLIDTMDLAGLL